VLQKVNDVTFHQLPPYQILVGICLMSDVWSLGGEEGKLHQLRSTLEPEKPLSGTVT